MKKEILFSTILFIASSAYATNPKYLQCFNEFPNKIKLNLTDDFSETLAMKQVSDYEKNQVGAGYGLHYHRNYTIFDDYGTSFCQTSLFIYDMNKKLTEQDFTSKAQFAQLTSYLQAISEKEKRERLTAEEAGLRHCEDCPKDSQPISELYRYNLNGHMVHFADEFFKDSVERKALMEYDGNYLKLLLTCQALPIDTQECSDCMSGKEKATCQNLPEGELCDFSRENAEIICPACERDLEFDKKHLEVLSNAILKMTINNLDNCIQKKGN